MKKTVIFFMTYAGKDNKGHIMSKRDYSIFTRKSKIVNDLYDWQVKNSESKFEEVNERVYTTILKIIGL